MKVIQAIIIVKGRYSFSCRLEVDTRGLFTYAKYKSKVSIASGIMSSIAIERNRLPENVIATDIKGPSLKHCKPEMNLPNITTSKKNASINIIFIINDVSMSIIIVKRKRICLVFVSFVFIEIYNF